MNYIITIARKDNPKKPVHYSAGCNDLDMAYAMMDAARSTLDFCQQGEDTLYIVVIEDNTQDQQKHIIHVETHEQGGALEII